MYTMLKKNTRRQTWWWWWWCTRTNRHEKLKDQQETAISMRVHFDLTREAVKKGEGGRVWPDEGRKEGRKEGENHKSL